MPGRISCVSRSLIGLAFRTVLFLVWVPCPHLCGHAFSRQTWPRKRGPWHPALRFDDPGVGIFRIPKEFLIPAV